jgi:hypothetical protein
MSVMTTRAPVAHERPGPGSPFVPSRAGPPSMSIDESTGLDNPAPRRFGSGMKWE